MHGYQESMIQGRLLRQLKRKSCFFSCHLEMIKEQHLQKDQGDVADLNVDAEVFN